MKLKLFLATGLIATSFSLQAQDEEKPTKNDIGFSARIFNNPAAPFVIMYKRQIAQAFALRVGIALTATHQHFNDTQTTSNQSNSSLGPSLGIEWQNRFATKWVFYGGLDTRLNLGWSKSQDFVGTIQINESTGNSKGITLSPFIGIRYDIIPRLYVATEATLNGNYSENTGTNRNFVNGNTSTSTVYVYSANLQPAVGLFFFYRF